MSPLPESATQVRLFVAITLPEKVQSEIEKAQSELRTGVGSKTVRWSRREQLHLTLRFLGNVDGGRVEPLKDALSRACRGFAPLRLRCEGIGFFPNNRAPRVVWAGIDDEQRQLTLLQSAVEAAVGSFSLEKPETRFVGHVTLGRLNRVSRVEAQGLARLAAGMGAKFFGSWTGGEIELIRSELLPQGARYTALAAIALGAPSSGQGSR